MYVGISTFLQQLQPSSDFISNFSEVKLNIIDSDKKCS